MTFWVFGDSFMSYNANYIQVLSRSLGTNKVIVKGTPGSGLLFTYQQLLYCLPQIQAHDAVLIGLSSPTRHLFTDQNWNLLAGGVSNGGSLQDVTGKTPKLTIRAAKDYYKYLYHEEHIYNLAHAVMSSIFHSIIPSIKAERVAYTLTINSEDFKNKWHLPADIFNDLSLSRISYNFLSKYKGYNIDDKVGMGAEMQGRNHWLRYPEYYRYFFHNISRVLKDLQIRKINYTPGLM